MNDFILICLLLIILVLLGSAVDCENDVKHEYSNNHLGFAHHSMEIHPSHDNIISRRNLRSADNSDPFMVYELKSLAKNLSDAYDADHPSYLDKPKMLPHYHGKRCTYQQLQFSTKAFLEDKYHVLSPSYPILLHSACLGSDSIGNYLGDYFETIICAKVAKVTYIAVAKVWEPKLQHQPSAFIAALPSIVPSYTIASYDDAKDVMKMLCTCPSSCHEKANALWIHGGKLIRSVLRDAMDHHLATASDATIVRVDDHATVAAGSRLPLIPDVAIHYRCGDNFVGFYGFLPFHIIIDRIPADAKTIYVLADARSRKTSNHMHTVTICDAIFKHLYNILHKTFPRAIIVVQRGGDMYADMAKLSYSTTTICSVSTFCLWPAIASNGTAYFPRTPLIVGGSTAASFGTHFHWIMQPSIILGANIAHMPVNQVISMLAKS